MIGNPVVALTRRGYRLDTRGVAIIEFALTLPFLILLFVGGYQYSDAIAANRKVTTATRTIADLTTQYTSVNNSDLDTILNASQQVMAPYSATGAKMTVTQVDIDADGNAKVGWSRGKNVTGLTAGSSFSLSSSIRQPNTSLIVADIRYNYQPLLASVMIGTISLHDTIIMSPRATRTIIYKSS